MKYLVKRIIHLDYKNMFKIAKKISKKTKKNRLLIVFDMINCGLKYQAGYYDYQEFEFYNLTKEERLTYLTRGKNDAIVKKYNDKSSWYKFDDKIIFNEIFKKYLGRDYIDLRSCTKKELEEFLKNKDDVIYKPIAGDGGHGIEKVPVKEAINLIGNNGLLEEVVVQHKELGKLYNNSVNTLRIFTLLVDNKPNVIQTILKIGNGGIIDNFSSGGMYTFLNEKGIVSVPAIDQADNIYKTHPITKEKIVGFKVPMYDKALKLVREASKLVPEIAYIGWDVAITEKGPVIIEGNCYPGVFQIKPSFLEKKVGILPKYEDILK